MQAATPGLTAGARCRGDNWQRCHHRAPGLLPARIRLDACADLERRCDLRHHLRPLPQIIDLRSSEVPHPTLPVRRLDDDDVLDHGTADLEFRLHAGLAHHVPEFETRVDPPAADREQDAREGGGGGPRWGGVGYDTDDRAGTGSEGMFPGEEGLEKTLRVVHLLKFGVDVSDYRGAVPRGQSVGRGRGGRRGWDMDVARKGILWGRVSGDQYGSRDGGKDELEEEASASDDVDAALRAKAATGVREGPARGRVAPVTVTATRRRIELWIDMSEVVCRPIRRKSSERAGKMDGAKLSWWSKAGRHLVDWRDHIYHSTHDVM